MTDTLVLTCMQETSEHLTKETMARVTKLTVPQVEAALASLARAGHIRQRDDKTWELTNNW